MRKEGKLVDLVRNGDFSSDKAQSNEGAPLDWKQAGAPAGWSTWQEKTSKGTFSWDRENGCAGKGAAKAVNVANGCFIQTYTVKPGERYVIQAMRRLQGKGDGKIRVRWQTAENKWTLETLDKFILCTAPRGEWGEMLGVVEVPEGAGKLVILLGVTGQTSPEDAVWYDDVCVYRLE